MSHRTIVKESKPLNPFNSEALKLQVREEYPAEWRNRIPRRIALNHALTCVYKKSAAPGQIAQTMTLEVGEGEYDCLVNSAGTVFIEISHDDEYYFACMEMDDFVVVDWHKKNGEEIRPLSGIDLY